MGRHLQLLECSTDGRINDEAWRLARQLDAMKAERPARVEIRVVELKPHYLIRLMARTIAEAAVKRAAVHVKDFERAGITEDLARRHFPAALAKARMIEPALLTIEQAAA